MCLFKYGLNKLTLSAARTDAGSLLHKAAAEAENLPRVNSVLTPELSVDPGWKNVASVMVEYTVLDST